MKTVMGLLFAAAAFAQPQQPQMANPLVTVSKSVYGITKSDILRSVDKVPDNLWSYSPTKDIRTFGQVFAHIADGQYEFCGVVAEGKSVMKGVEKSATTKAEIVAALKEAFAYCDAAYDNLTDAHAADLVSFFNMRITKLGALDFNSAHNMEHYGNLVTYMRLNHIVPPSSEGQGAPPPEAKKKD